MNVSSPVIAGKIFRFSAFLNSALDDFQVGPRDVIEDSISETSHHPPLNLFIKIIKPSNKNKYKMLQHPTRRGVNVDQFPSDSLSSLNEGEYASSPDLRHGEKETLRINRSLTTDMINTF